MRRGVVSFRRAARRWASTPSPRHWALPPPSVSVVQTPSSLSSSSSSVGPAGGGGNPAHNKMTNGGLTAGRRRPTEEMVNRTPSSSSSSSSSSPGGSSPPTGTTTTRGGGNPQKTPQQKTTNKAFPTTTSRRRRREDARRLKAEAAEHGRVHRARQAAAEILRAGRVAEALAMLRESWRPTHRRQTVAAAYVEQEVRRLVRSALFKGARLPRRVDVDDVLAFFEEQHWTPDGHAYHRAMLCAVKERRYDDALDLFDVSRTVTREALAAFNREEVKAANSGQEEEENSMLFERAAAVALAPRDDGRCGLARIEAAQRNGDWDDALNYMEDFVKDDLGACPSAASFERAARVALQLAPDGASAYRVAREVALDVARRRLAKRVDRNAMMAVLDQKRNATEMAAHNLMTTPERSPPRAPGSSSEDDESETWEEAYELSAAAANDADLLVHIRREARFVGISANIEPMTTRSSIPPKFDDADRRRESPSSSSSSSLSVLRFASLSDKHTRVHPRFRFSEASQHHHHNGASMMIEQERWSSPQQQTAEAQWRESAREKLKALGRFQFSHHVCDGVGAASARLALRAFRCYAGSDGALERFESGRVISHMGKAARAADFPKCEALYELLKEARVNGDGVAPEPARCAVLDARCTRARAAMHARSTVDRNNNLGGFENNSLWGFDTQFSGGGGGGALGGSFLGYHRMRLEEALAAARRRVGSSHDRDDDDDDVNGTAKKPTRRRRTTADAGSSTTGFSSSSEGGPRGEEEEDGLLLFSRDEPVDATVDGCVAFFDTELRHLRNARAYACIVQLLAAAALHASPLEGDAVAYDVDPVFSNGGSRDARVRFLQTALTLHEEAREHAVPVLATVSLDVVTCLARRGEIDAAVALALDLAEESEAHVDDDDDEVVDAPTVGGTSSSCSDTDSAPPRTSSSSSSSSEQQPPGDRRADDRRRRVIGLNKIMPLIVAECREADRATRPEFAPVLGYVLPVVDDDGLHPHARAAFAPPLTPLGARLAALDPDDWRLVLDTFLRELREDEEDPQPRHHHDDHVFFDDDDDVRAAAGHPPARAASPPNAADVDVVLGVLEKHHRWREALDVLQLLRIHSSD